MLPEAGHKSGIAIDDKSLGDAMVMEDVVNKKLCRLRRRDSLPYGGQTRHFAKTTHIDQDASVATRVSGKLEDEVHAHRAPTISRCRAAKSAKGQLLGVELGEDAGQLALHREILELTGQVSRSQRGLTGSQDEVSDDIVIIEEIVQDRQLRGPQAFHPDKRLQTTEAKSSVRSRTTSSNSPAFKDSRTSRKEGSLSSKS
ncbi:unnamed protein product [Phytophthora fragariaefolia]|uniref:Unnamed protein product n=1 Tax=Phytophthora fragariaefolia TaxID=1490495 RepID=A0A9W6Y7G6_9STRA|nr:unnamed protein product [Phytophthora fragariaefolia]